MFVPNYPVHRAGARPPRAVSAEHQPAAAALQCASSSRQEYEVAQVPAAAAVREHLPDLQGRLAPGRGGAGQRRPSSGSGRRRRRRSRSRTRRRTPRSTSSSTPGPTSSARPQQVTIRSGDQVDRHVRGRLEGPRSCVTFPVTAAQLGDARHGGDPLEVDQDVRTRRRRTPASSASGSFTRSSSPDKSAAEPITPPSRSWPQKLDCSDSGHSLRRVMVV